MSLALLTEFVRAGAIALLVRFARFGGEVLVFTLLDTCCLTEAVIMGFGIAGGAVVEGWLVVLVWFCLCSLVTYRARQVHARKMSYLQLLLYNTTNIYKQQWRT